MKEAAARGLDITAVVREENRTEAQNVLTKDLFDLTAADLKDFDVVVDAFGAWGRTRCPSTARRCSTCATFCRVRKPACWSSAAPAACM